VIRRRVAAEEMRAQREAVANGAARVQEQLAAIKCGLCGWNCGGLALVPGHGWRCEDGIACRARMSADAPLEGCVLCRATDVPLRPLTGEPGQVCHNSRECARRRATAAKAAAR